MPDHLGKQIDLELELGTALPPTLSGDALDRMRQKTYAAKRRGETARHRRQARGVAGLAAVAGLALAALVASPSIENRAFARDQAADALVFARDGRITHVVTRFTETSWNEEFGHDPRLDLDQRTEEWYDPAGRRSSSRTVNVKDGSLDGVGVRVADQEMRFQNNVRYGTGNAPQLMAGSTSLPFESSIGFMTDQVRAEIADGHAKVDGTRMVDGTECWVVVIDVNELVTKHGGEKPDPKSSDIITVTLRKSDYLITSWARESEMFNGNGRSTSSMRLQFERWQHVERDTVDESKFSLEAVRKMAPEGTRITKTVDGAAVE